MFTPSIRPPILLPGAAIYRLRQAQDLSYRDLASRIERSHGRRLDHAQIYRIEHGGGYSRPALEQIAAGLRVQVADLFIDPRLAPLATLDATLRAEAERKVAEYVADLLAAYRGRQP
jgi:transcriptional regulator with XRE-family HTH domain